MSLFPRRGRPSEQPQDLHSAVPEGELVTPGMRVAGAWSWRILVVLGVVGVLVFLVMQLRAVVIPVFVGVLLAALMNPLVDWLHRRKVPRVLAVVAAALTLIAVVGGLGYLVATQVSRGAADLRDRSLTAYSDFQKFLLDSPLHVTSQQFQDLLDQAGAYAEANWQSLLGGVVSFGSGLTTFLSGLLLALFTLLLVLYDGRNIGSWLVRLFPRRARAAVHGATKAGWTSVSGFVRAQILVATVDAVGIGLGAAILGLPLAIPIAVLVFLGSFIPFFGAIITGALAVFIALVYQGLWPAVIMLIIVLGVQQLEGHVLQPLIMGNAVKVHPLAVVLAVVTGTMLAGIAGALFAVPIVAALNSMITYIASGRWRHRSAELPTPTAETRPELGRP